MDENRVENEGSLTSCLARTRHVTTCPIQTCLVPTCLDNTWSVKLALYFFLLNVEYFNKSWNYSDLYVILKI